MNISEFIEYMNEDFSSAKLEHKDSEFFETFFYYKRNIREFITTLESYNLEDKRKIISFLLNLYPLSDSFLKEIIKESKIELHDEITFDTINYISSAFIDEIGDLNINFDDETEKNLKQLKNIKDIVEFNQVKFTKLLITKRDLANLKERDDKLSKDIKELENGNINSLKEEISIKQKRYDELRTEKSEVNKQLEKINHDLSELNRYADLRENVFRCREILRESGLSKDYTDRVKINQDV